MGISPEPTGEGPENGWGELAGFGIRGAGWYDREILEIPHHGCLLLEPKAIRFVEWQSLDLLDGRCKRRGAYRTDKDSHQQQDLTNHFHNYISQRSGSPIARQ